MKESWEGEFQHFIRNEGDASFLWLTVKIILEEAGKDQLLENPKVLDIGARQGELAKFLNNKGVQTYSIEIKEFEYNEGSRQVQADVHALPFPNESFNIIIANGVFDDLIYRFDYPTAIKEIARITRPGGVFIMLGHAINSQKVKELSQYFMRIDTPMTESIAFKDEEAILWEKK